MTRARGTVWTMPHIDSSRRLALCRKDADAAEDNPYMVMENFGEKKGALSRRFLGNELVELGALVKRCILFLPKGVRATQALQSRLLVRCSVRTVPTRVPQVMSLHCDHKPELAALHSRLFLKGGGYYERMGDAFMPYFLDAHNGIWVRSEATQKPTRPQGGALSIRAG